VGEECGRGVGVDAADVGAVDTVGELGAGSHRGCACVGHAWWWWIVDREKEGMATRLRLKVSIIPFWVGHLIRCWRLRHTN
jgi:hypothetical protein